MRCALLAALRGDGIDARLWLPGAREAGREAYIAELEARGRRARHRRRGRVHRRRPTQIARAYAASDLVLQLSRKPESFGRTVVEALSVGRPVLGWAHGGVGELLARTAAARRGRAVRRATRCTHGAQRPAGAAAAASGYDSRTRLRAMQEATLAVYAELVD